MDFGGGGESPKKFRLEERMGGGPKEKMAIRGDSPRGGNDGAGSREKRGFLIRTEQGGGRTEKGGGPRTDALGCIRCETGRKSVEVQKRHGKGVPWGKKMNNPRWGGKEPGCCGLKTETVKACQPEAKKPPKAERGGTRTSQYRSFDTLGRKRTTDNSGPSKKGLGKAEKRETGGTNLIGLQGWKVQGDGEGEQGQGSPLGIRYWWGKVALHRQKALRESGKKKKGSERVGNPNPDGRQRHSKDW